MTGLEIRILRKKHNLTQAELAEKIHKTPGYISFLENGRSPLKEDVKQRICEVLDCSPESLSDDNLTLQSKNLDEVVERIKSLRAEMGMSQRAFAKAVGCGSGSISEVETGQLKPSEQFLMKVSRAFGVSYSWLAYGVEPDIDSQMAEIDEYLKANPRAREAVLLMIRNRNV